MISVFGTDIDSARTHYFASGVTEGRTFDGFDEMSYLASHADLLSSYGSNHSSAMLHYITSGSVEGRSKESFDEMSYLASHSDLLSTFGADGLRRFTLCQLWIFRR